MARGLTLALIAVACAHCGSTKGAASGGKSDSGVDPTADGGVDGGDQPDPGDIDGSIPDGGGGGDATTVGPGNDHCTDATPIPLSGVNPRVDLLASTAGATHDVDATCSSDQGPDIFYSFSFSKRVIVYADTFGAKWNTVLFLTNSACEPIATSTTPGDAVCNDDGCGTQQSQIVALLEPGSYRLGLAGHAGAQGDATIHFEWALAGSGTIAHLPSTNSVQTGTTTGSGGNIDGLSDSCVAAAAENSYWWTRCPSDPARAIHASTCGGGSAFEAVLEAQIPKLAPNRSSAYQCNLGGCGDLQSLLNVAMPAGPGLGVLSVDGQSGDDVGPYTMTVTYTP